MIDRKEIKQRAKAQVTGNILTLFLIGIVVGLLSGVAGTILPGIGLLIITGPLALGQALNRRKMAFGEKADFETAIVGGFKTSFVGSLLLSILQSIFLFFWFLLFIIPGIIKTYAYSMSYYILADNPEMSATDAITQSRKMMNGYKWKLFVLEISYILEYIVGMITFGIYFIWLLPKIEQAKYNFYLELKRVNPGV